MKGMTKVENVAFQSSEQKLSEQEILDFEKSLGVKLPISFVEHYKIFNGGFPNANWSKGTDLVIPLRHFFSIKYGEDTIERKIRELKNVEDLKELLPFAINKIKGYFCIGTGKDNYGGIYHYEKLPDVPDKKACFDVDEIERHCADFSEFISNLYVDKFYGKVFKPVLGWVEDFEAYTKNW